MMYCPPPCFCARPNPTRTNTYPSNNNPHSHPSCRTPSCRTHPIHFSLSPQDFPPEAADLVSALLRHEPDKRISMQDVCAHPYFKGVDWEAVRRKEHGPVELDRFAPDVAPGETGACHAIIALEESRK